MANTGMQDQNMSQPTKPETTSNDKPNKKTNKQTPDSIWKNRFTF